MVLTDLLLDSEADEAMAVALWWQMVALVTCFAASATRKGGGSRPGKAKNVFRDFAGAHSRYMLRYFWPADMLRPGTADYGPSQPESAFTRRFRLPRHIFNRVFTGVVSTSEYFTRGLNCNAAGKRGISPLIKVIAALRILSYGIPADFCDDSFDISETVAQLCLDEFCVAVIACFGVEYLRAPTAEDLLQIEKQFRGVGFPGCIGAVDCAGWGWKNCPKDLQGIMVGKDGKPVLPLEAVCDLDLWCWHMQFGFPGSMNDINILNASEHFSSVLSGAFPSDIPSYTVGGEKFSWYY